MKATITDSQTIEAISPVALASYLREHPEVVRGRRVLDLASGSGLVAIAAAQAGATAVMGSDIDPFAEAAIELNARANGVRVEAIDRDLLDEDPPAVDVLLAVHRALHQCHVLLGTAPVPEDQRAEHAPRHRTGISGTLSAMGFRPEDLHDFDIAREVRVETHRGDGKTRSTVIWVVVDRGEVFVRSVRGASGRWYQDALEHPELTLDDAGRRLETRAIPVHDPDSIRRVTEALQRKYAGSDGLDEMVRPPALDATMRLEPRRSNEEALEAPAHLDADEPSKLGPPVDVSMLDGEQPVDESVLLQPHKSA